MKSGFTLIEILVVLTIIGSITIVAIASYGSVIQQSRLDNAVDVLLSTMKQQREKVLAGRQGVIDSEDRAFCFGMNLQKTAPYAEILQAPYVAVSKTSSLADYCDMNEVKTTALEFAPQVFPDSLKLGNNEVEQVAFVFKPPQAALRLASTVSALSNTSKGPEVSDNTLKMIFRLQSDDSRRRGVDFDFVSHSFNRFEIVADE